MSKLIVGANGQLGRALKNQYPDAICADIDELDITNKASVESYDWSQVSLILNAAAYTNVDGAETPNGRVVAWNVNALAVSYLAQAATTYSIPLVHISTDYVFDGTKDIHDEHELFSPLSVYGATKAAADIVVATVPQHYILRTSWVIGEGNNFVRTMQGLAAKDVSPTVVHDQVGRLTFTNELVRAIDHLLTEKAPFGTYNVTNAGESASWADITRTIFKLLGKNDLEVTNTTTAEYFATKTSVAPRPLQSTLDLAKITSTGFVGKEWQEDLKIYLKMSVA